MRFPPEFYQIEQTLRQRMAHLSDSQIRGLALWTLGTATAGSGCQSAVVAALSFMGKAESVRQRLREWLRDGADRARPSPNQIDVRAGFDPLMRWVLSLWESNDLALAIDPTTLSDKLTAVVVSVVYRGCAIPVAWAIMRGNKPGEWIAPAVELLESLSSAIPPRMRVIVMADRGLRSPRLWKKLRSLGWHPYMRQSINTVFRPDGGIRTPARNLVPGPNNAFIGRGTAFTNPRKRRGTIIVIWVEGQAEPWIVLTDLAPDEAGASWYALRFWIETGFKALKSVGWQWQKTRRTDPARAERHWLVLASATILALAYGSREEDAEALGRLPSALRAPPKAAPVRASGRGRLMSVFNRGAKALRRRLIKGRMWRAIWLLPEPWPSPPDGLEVVLHPKPPNIPQ